MGFLDGISKKVSETTTSFQETTNKIQKENKCKKTISENEATVENMYSEIGKKIYEARTINSDVTKYINEQVATIDALLQENQDLQKEILKLNNKKLCPNCKAEVPIETVFCPQCGTEQEKIIIEPTIPKGKRKCSGCGEIIDDENVFCPNCGAKKEEIEEEAKEVEVDKTAEAKAEEKAEEISEEKKTEE